DFSDALGLDAVSGMVAPGMPCRVFAPHGDDCGPGSTCARYPDGVDRCGHAGIDGEPCDGMYLSCEPGYDCAPGDDGDTRCARRPPGDPVDPPEVSCPAHDGEWTTACPVTPIWPWATCLEGCLPDGRCVSACGGGAFCDGTACVPQRPIGAACSRHVECDSL